MRLDNIPLFRLNSDLGEAKEDLNLGHESPELSSSIHFHGASPDAYLLEVLDVIGKAAEVLGGELDEVLRLAVVLMELLQFLLQRHGTSVYTELALHDEVQARRKGARTIPGGGEDPNRVCFLKFCCQALLLFRARRLQLLQVIQHRLDGVDKQLLDLFIHVGDKVIESYGRHVFTFKALVLQSGDVRLILVVAQSDKRLRRVRSILPPRQRERETDQGIRQVAHAKNPIIHVCGRQVGVIFVKLGSD
mmetsp:Transcript_64953/g.139103  ORF Transcript_64953/g.139103 Transcript_64953/m.139103 type:complete len:248 (+) Transcript_64953:837-1580(+)